MKITLSPIRHDTPLVAMWGLELGHQRCRLQFLGCGGGGRVPQISLFLPQGPKAPIKTLSPKAGFPKRDRRVRLPPQGAPNCTQGNGVGHYG